MVWQILFVLSLKEHRQVFKRWKTRTELLPEDGAEKRSVQFFVDRPCEQSPWNETMISTFGWTAECSCCPSNGKCSQEHQPGPTNASTKQLGCNGLHLVEQTRGKPSEVRAKLLMVTVMVTVTVTVVVMVTMVTI